MEKQFHEFNLERIFRAWKKIELIDRKSVESELKRLTEVCNLCFTVATRHYGPYNTAYDLYIKNSQLRIPVIIEFLGEIKTVSEEAYLFITEGHDIINLREYAAFEGKKETEIIEKLYNLKHFSYFIEHSFMKILNEPNEEKKHLMIRGLIGM